MLDKNFIIANREAKNFARVDFAETAISFYDVARNIVAELCIDESVYATLFCDETCNITFVFDFGNTQNVITVLWSNKAEYDEFKKHLRSDFNLELSKQNIRINRYAESIAEKLANGVKLRVTDAADENEMIECPECGMMNSKGSPYCMECGADL